MTATAQSGEIDLTLNGRRLRTSAVTLSAVLVEQGFTGLKVATAVNGAFVPEHARAETSLADGDSVEVVSARQGG